MLSYISASYQIYANEWTPFEAILLSTLSAPTSYDWALSPMNWSYLNNYGYWASVNFNPSGYYTLSCRAINACGHGPYSYFYANVQDRYKSFPNPANDVLNIELGNASGEKSQSASLTYDVRLLDAQGNLLRQQTTKGGTVELNVSNLPDGVYYLHIYDGVNSAPEMQQILVQH
jgi:hypothetical protein